MQQEAARYSGNSKSGPEDFPWGEMQKIGLKQLLLRKADQKNTFYWQPLIIAPAALFHSVRPEDKLRLTIFFAGTILPSTEQHTWFLPVFFAS